MNRASLPAQIVVATIAVASGLSMSLLIVACQKNESRIPENGEDLPATAGNGNGEDTIPRFPWPPPKPSAAKVVPWELLGASHGSVLGDVATRLESAFNEAGYGRISHFWIPEGFAMVSRLEQIHANGTPLDPPDRWSIEIPPIRRFSLVEYLRILFRGKPGHYRVVVFFVTPVAFTSTTSPPTAEEAGLWLSSGLNKLPDFIARKALSEDHTCTAYIYQFERVSPDHDPTYKDPSNLAGEVHLVRSGLWAALEARP